MYILELGEKRKEFPLFIEALNELLMAKEEGTVSVDGVPLAITKPSGQVLVRLPGARDIVLAELQALTNRIKAGKVQWIHIVVQGLLQLSTVLMESQGQLHFHLKAFYAGYEAEFNEVYTTEGGAKKAFELFLQPYLEIEPESVVYHDDTTAFFSDGFRVVIERCGAQACLRRLEWEKKS